MDKRITKIVPKNPDRSNTNFNKEDYKYIICFSAYNGVHGILTIVIDTSMEELL